MKKKEEFNAGAVLDQLIARSGKSKAALARHLDVSPQAIQNWLKSGGYAREHIKPICLFLDCSADELVGLREPAPQVQSESQDSGLDLETLKSALAAVKEAASAMDVVIDDIYKTAPLIAYAYRERLNLPPNLTKEEYKAFDVVTVARLKGEMRDVQEARPAPRASQRSLKAVETRKEETRGGEPRGKN
ncbi:helix-turn-helix transcriptional regulator [Dyella sp. SG609]|uniref:helix-turn-helix domain-containing protein n=1 Tax=Dyella sp. SG609 TaxID=2587018 RepID=UPI001447C805|nr:helix-turn-helix transcriptional regulator [Dyella sp. SG609]NKJ21988.1 transposase-like protein [Dyella sp. SG609]